MPDGQADAGERLRQRRRDDHVADDLGRFAPSARAASIG